MYIAVEAVKEVITNPSKFLTKERFDLVKDYYKVRMEKDEILRYKNVNQYINPERRIFHIIINHYTSHGLLNYTTVMEQRGPLICCR